MGILDNFDEGVNFWEANPTFKVLGAFQNLRKWDKSKGKEDSSRIMWAIAFLLDPSKKNPYRNLPEDERVNYITEYFFTKTKYSWDTQEIIEAKRFYADCVLSPEQKSLISFEKKLKQRDEYLDKLEYTITNRKELEEALISTPKLYDTYALLKRKVEETSVRNKKSEETPASLLDDDDF